MVVRVMDIQHERLIGSFKRDEAEKFPSTEFLYWCRIVGTTCRRHGGPRRG